VDDTTPWYVNQKANANLTIDAGDGADVVNTLGSGDWKVNLGAGNDTYYADNTGEKAIWVFNTANQDTSGIEFARRITDVSANAVEGLTTGSNGRYITVNDGYVSTANNGYQANEQAGLYGLKLRVAFKDVSGGTNGLSPDNEGQGTYISGVFAVPTASGNKFTVTDLNINQAIKLAINGDPVLSKLLEARDGPGNTLVVISRSDGQHIDVNDLQVEFSIPTAVEAGDVSAWNTAIGAVGWLAADLQTGRNNAFAALLTGSATGTPATSTLNDVGLNPGTGYSTWYTSSNVADASYNAAFANNNGTDIDGVANSGHASDNVIDAGTGVDVIVLSTGLLSNDTIKWTGTGNGTNTIVNFDTAADTPSTEAKLSYTVAAGSGDTYWDTAGYESTETFTITVAGIGTTGTITAGADDDATATAIQAALNTLFSGAGWTPSGPASAPVYTQITPDHIPNLNLGMLTFTAVSDTLGTSMTNPVALFVPDVANTNAIISSTLGDDWLDFTSYGARLLVAATLDAGANQYVNGSTWSVLTDTHAARDLTYKTITTGQALPTSLVTTPTVPGDNDLKVGDKYITLTRSAATTTTETDPHSTTLYKVELWTVNGTAADAYLQTLATGDTRDSAQLIGYVDVGKVIDGDAATTGILAHIDYI
jgi:hypothetical protein